MIYYLILSDSTSAPSYLKPVNIVNYNAKKARTTSFIRPEKSIEKTGKWVLSDVDFA